MNADVQASIGQRAARLAGRSAHLRESHVHPAHGEDTLQVGLVLRICIRPLIHVWRIPASLRQLRARGTPRVLPYRAKAKGRLPILLVHPLHQLDWLT